MPSRPPKPCTKPGCRAYAVNRGRCAEHPHPAWEGKGSGASRGYGYEWGRKRERILKRDSYLCTYHIAHSEEHPKLAKQVDHRVPKSHGGTDDDDNLGAICNECHKIKTERERRAGVRKVFRRQSDCCQGDPGPAL